MERWVSGQSITLRYVGAVHFVVEGERVLPESGSRPGLIHGLAHTVVEDRDDLLALWIPAGSMRNYVDLGDRSHVLEPDVWRRDTLRLMVPGKPYSILTAPHSHGFSGWYVNLEAPFVRTEIGVDITDNSLDLVVASDFSWKWKDEHFTQPLEDMGVFSRADTESFYAAGRAVIADIEARRFPFDGAMLDWRPPAEWQPPVIQPGWDRLVGYDMNLTTGRRLVGVDARQ